MWTINILIDFRKETKGHLNRAHIKSFLNVSVCTISAHRKWIMGVFQSDSVIQSKHGCSYSNYQHRECEWFQIHDFRSGFPIIALIKQLFGRGNGQNFCWGCVWVLSFLPGAESEVSHGVPSGGALSPTTLCSWGTDGGEGNDGCLETDSCTSFFGTKKRHVSVNDQKLYFYLNYLSTPHTCSQCIRDDHESSNIHRKQDCLCAL